ncbi:hypothetical protein CEXT_48531 [Caerostris extrusa]|uniref:Uncharacterized protein n=1 Tax=Caerostris extrusa TaxID=172846 RepID=A0AAV4N0U2_CAEEX|nr:hypothetical protein CEXT_48531 [Caerostris extrusa]
MRGGDSLEDSHGNYFLKREEFLDFDCVVYALFCLDGKVKNFKAAEKSCVLQRLARANFSPSAFEWVNILFTYENSCAFDFSCELQEITSRIRSVDPMGDGRL